MKSESQVQSFRSRQYYKPLPRSNNKGPSKAIQGEAYTIRELLHKHTRGIMPPVMRNGQYMDDADFDSIDMEKVNRMDIVDKHEIYQQQTDIITQIEESEREKRKQAKKAKNEQNEKAKKAQQRESAHEKDNVPPPLSSE